MTRSVFIALSEMEQKDLSGILYKYYTGTPDDELCEIYGNSFKRKIEDAVTVIKTLNETFSEDRYANVYSTYKISRSDFNNCFDTEKYLFRYLKSMYSPGTIEFRHSLSDPSIPEDLKKCIEDFFKKNDEIKPVSPEMSTSITQPKKSVSSALREPGFAAIKKKATVPFKESTYKRLKKRIKKEFNLKFYVGDIKISNSDFVILTAYSSIIAAQLLDWKVSLVDDPIFTVTMVQIGIRFYDGSYWSHLGDILGIPIPPQLQKYIGDSCINTFKAHNKQYLGDSEKVASILLHGFVSDFYSKGLYELLFQYFRNDLERDINRNTPEQMKSLMDTLALNARLSDQESESFTDQFISKGSRAYKLKKHTLQAIMYQPSQSLMRLRRLLRLIDKAFWKNQLPKNPVSRLTINFISWLNESESFRQDHNLYVRGEIRNRGKKHFSTPYLFADLRTNSFSLKLPAQIIAGNEEDQYTWKIKSDFQNMVVGVDSYRVLTGRKTKEAEIRISHRELFKAISCELYCNEEKVKSFNNIPESKTRLFDTEGDYASRIFKIPMVAFSLSNTTLISPALSYHSTSADLERWEFTFQDGDLLILPDGESLVAGEKIIEGFTHRGRIDNVTCVYNNKVPLYNQIPDLLLQLEKSKIQGTVFEVNGTKYRLSECQYTCFSTSDSKRQNAVMIDLKQFQQTNLQQNNIYVDIPCSHYSKQYSYLLIEQFSLEYIGSPYVYNNVGAIVFPQGTNVKCLSPADADIIRGENGFAFGITPQLTSFEFFVEDQIKLSSVIPVFAWSNDNQNWQINSMGDVWHTDFFRNKKLYFRSPESHIELFMEDDGENEELHAVSAEKTEDGHYVLDLTRFLSWITRERIKHEVNLELGRTEYPFAQVYARGFVTSFSAKPNYEDNQLICNYDIIGKSDCYLDIVSISGGGYLVEKERLSDNQIVIPNKLKNGKYHAEVFEAEEDESGFDPEYYSIFKYSFLLNNKSDLSGQHLSIEKIKFIRNQVTFVTLSSDISYWIKDMDKTGHNTYTGNLFLNGTDQHIKVQVEFSKSDNRYFHLQLWDDEYEDYEDFMLDRRHKALVKEEEPNLRPSVKYTRYHLIDSSEYIFFGQLHDSFPDFPVQ